MSYPHEIVLQEFFTFMTGKQLGRGMSREVFDHPTDPTKVIKMEDSKGHFQNTKEWLIWQDFQYYKPFAKWLAPCHYISDNGTFLIMSKTRPAIPSEIPKKLPAFLVDHKHTNYGILDGQFVCHDYGTATLSLATGKKDWMPSDDR